MKKISSILKTASLFCGGAILAAVAFTACSDNNEPDDPDDNNGQVDSKDLDYSASNAGNWHNYTVIVAQLLDRDSKSLYDSWTQSYEGGEAFADIFRNANNSSYSSHLNCIEEIIDGCSDIANEVGDTKIGDPYDLYKQGKTEEALYAVESWYSWHSIEDYSNNIISIRNSYLGSLDGNVSEKSMSAFVKSIDPELDNNTKTLIEGAYNAIKAIPDPFRNHINSPEALAAQEACANLTEHLENVLKPFFHNLEGDYDAQFKDIVVNYVNNVVLPTYESLKELNAALLQAVQNLNTNRTDAAFKAAANAWLDARVPWERSEAFLFGPVDALGLDPNMDSWPLDQDAIVNILKNGNFDDLNWSEGDDVDKVEAAQNVRGFHTLEFLLFKDGKARTVN